MFRYLRSKIWGEYDIGIYSGKRRYILLLIAEVQMFLISGIVFGWSPLESEMVKQGAFQYLCQPNENNCKAQELRLNLVYTLGAFTATGSAVASGAIFDKYGPIWTSGLALIIMILGCICWYITSFINENLYILSFALLGIGGPACQVSLIHICNLFPSYSSTISTSFSGVFVGSSFVFKVFSIIAQTYNIEIADLFIYYIGVLVILFLPSIFLMHSKAYLPIHEYREMLKNKEDIESSTKKDIYSPHDIEKVPIINSPMGSDQPVEIEDIKSVDPYQGIKKKSLLGQLVSWPFLLIVLFMSINSLHMVYYIGIVNTLFEDTPVYIDIFNYGWNCGVILVPLVSVLMQKSNLFMNAAFVNLSGILFGVFSSIPILKVQFATFFFISLQNVYIWGFFFIYLSEVFSYSNYGKLMGISSVITAIVGLLEYLLTYLTLNVFKYFWVNIVLTILKMFLFILPLRMWYQNKNHQTNQIRNTPTTSTTTTTTTTKKVYNNQIYQKIDQ